MPDGRGARIALEAAFLVVVAAVLAVAAVDPAWIVLVMLLAWVIVALLEWAAWRDEPHWASGAPPRYYVPHQPLPPRPPSEELPAFSAYPQPVPRDVEAPTWIATPELREELLGWPAVQQAAEPVPEPELEESGWPVEAEAQPAQDRWIAEELPAEPEPEPAVETLPSPLPVEVRLARHRIDPFGEPEARRVPWRRRSEEAPAAAELPVLPRHARLPVRELNETRGG